MFFTLLKKLLRSAVVLLIVLFATFALMFSILLMFISSTPLLQVVHSFIENVVALLK